MVRLFQCYDGGRSSVMTATYHVDPDLARRIILDAFRDYRVSCGESKEELAARQQLRDITRQAEGGDE